MLSLYTKCSFDKMLDVDFCRKQSVNLKRTFIEKSFTVENVILCLNIIIIDKTLTVVSYICKVTVCEPSQSVNDVMENICSFFLISLLFSSYIVISIRWRFQTWPIDILVINETLLPIVFFFGKKVFFYGFLLAKKNFCGKREISYYATFFAKFR